MSGATIGVSTAAVAAGAAVVGTAASVGNMIYNDVSAPSGGSSGAPGGSAAGNAPMFNTTAGNVPNPNYTRPLGNPNEGKEQGSEMPLKATPGTEAKVTKANQVPAAEDRKSTVGADYEQSWGNRLSHYLGYATRTLG